MAKITKGTLREQVNAYLNSKLKLISNEFVLNAVRFPIKDHLQRSEEYHSMTSEDGGLRGMFGFYKGTEEAYVDAIIDRIVQEMTLVITKKAVSKTSIILGFDLVVLDYETTSIFNMPEAEIDDEERGYSLPWLEWLMKKGNERFITGFHVEFSPLGPVDSGISRSGSALMFKKGSWGVPSIYSGTETNNWVTRALSSDNKSKPKPDLVVAMQYGITQAIERVLNA